MSQPRISQGWLSKPHAGKSSLPLNTCATHLLLRYHCTSWWYIFQAVTKEICIKRIKLYIFCNPSPVSGSLLVTCTLYSVVQRVLKEPDHRQDEFSWWPELQHTSVLILIFAVFAVIELAKPMVRIVIGVAVENSEDM